MMKRMQPRRQARKRWLRTSRVGCAYGQGYSIHVGLATVYYVWSDVEVAVHFVDIVSVSGVS